MAPVATIAGPREESTFFSQVAYLAPFERGICAIERAWCAGMLPRGRRLYQAGANGAGREFDRRQAGGATPDADLADVERLVVEQQVGEHKLDRWVLFRPAFVVRLHADLLTLPCVENQPRWLGRSSAREGPVGGRQSRRQTGGTPCRWLCATHR